MKIKLISVRNPQWANEDGTAINCLVRNNIFHQEVPFGASPYDLEAHGREIFARCLAGEFGEIAPMEAKAQKQPLPQPELPVKYRRLEKFLLEANRENSLKSFRSVVIVWGSFLGKKGTDLYHYIHHQYVFIYLSPPPFVSLREGHSFLCLPKEKNQKKGQPRR